MGLLDRIFGGKQASVVPAIEAPPCPHSVLLPRWDSAADIGSEDRASSFSCEACSESFTPQETREIRSRHQPA